jgi:hypothetical protein
MLSSAVVAALRKQTSSSHSRACVDNTCDVEVEDHQHNENEHDNVEDAEIWIQKDHNGQLFESGRQLHAL